MARVEIVPPTLRDMTYIGSNLRYWDKLEVFAQVEPSITGSRALAHIHATGVPDWSWVARVDDIPVAAFGFVPISAATWAAYCLGTDRLTRVIPAITRFTIGLESKLLAQGVRSVEVRPIKGHEMARRWLQRLGCRHEADLIDRGRNGETFELWAWTLSYGLPSKAKDYRNVFRAKGSESAATACAAFA